MSESSSDWDDSDALEVDDDDDALGPLVTPICTFSPVSGTMSCIAYAPELSLVVGGMVNGRLCQWEETTGRKLRIRERSDGSELRQLLVHACAPTHEPFLIYCCDETVYRLSLRQESSEWYLPRKEHASESIYLTGTVIGIALSACVHHASRLFVAFPSHIRVFAAHSCAAVGEVDLPPGSGSLVCIAAPRLTQEQLTHTQPELWAATNTGQLLCIQTDTLCVTCVLTMCPAPLVRCMAVCPDASAVWTGSEEGQLQRWDISPRAREEHVRLSGVGRDEALKHPHKEKGEPMVTFEHPGWISCISMDTAFVASVANDGMVRVWNASVARGSYGVTSAMLTLDSHVVTDLDCVGFKCGVTYADSIGQLWDFHKLAFGRECVLTLLCCWRFGPPEFACLNHDCMKMIIRWARCPPFRKA